MPFRIVIADNDSGRIFGMDKSAWWDHQANCRAFSTGPWPAWIGFAARSVPKSQVCEQLLAEYRTENNPARMFLLDTCNESPESQTPCGGALPELSELVQRQRVIPRWQIAPSARK